MKRIGQALLAAGVLVCVAEPAMTDPLDDAITARRAFYQVVKFNAGPLFGMAKGDVTYDAKAAQMYADNLKTLTEMHKGAMWPKGSGNDVKKGKTRAKPEIWSTYPAVAKAGKAWTTASADLASVAGNGLDALRSKISALGASCKGCHDKFRAKDF